MILIFRQSLFLTSLLLLAPTSVGAIVRTINDGGGADHTSIAAFVAASSAGDIGEIENSSTYNERFEPAIALTLRSVAGQTPIVGNVSGGGATRGAFLWAESTTGPVTIDGIDGGLTLRTLGGSNGIIRHESGTGGLVLVVKNLNMQMPGSVGQVGAVLTAANANSDYTFEQVIWVGTNTGGGNVLGFDTASGSFLTVTNNLFHDFTTGIVTAIDVSGSETASTFDIKQNTFVECNLGLDSDEKGILQNNNFDTGDDDVTVTDAFDKNDGTGNIFTEEPSTGWPASNRFSDTPTYVDAGSNNFRLASGSDGIDTGINSGITTDIDGTSRPQNGTHDIGYFEFIPAGPVPTGMMLLLGVGE